MKTWDEFCKDKIGTTAVGIGIGREEYEAIQRDALATGPVTIEAAMVRLMNPKEGDRFQKGLRSLRVTAVGDGRVHYEIDDGLGEPLRKWEELSDYAKLARRTVENGAVFEPGT